VPAIRQRLLDSGLTGLTKDSVANVSQPVTLDRESLTEIAACSAKLDLVLYGMTSLSR
jgi:hypothetical protein